MPIEFDVKITANDMYRFNMYHIYRTNESKTLFTNGCIGSGSSCRMRQ